MALGVARLYASALRGCGRQQEAIPVVQVNAEPSTQPLCMPLLTQSTRDEGICTGSPSSNHVFS